MRDKKFFLLSCLRKNIKMLFSSRSHEQNKKWERVNGSEKIYGRLYRTWQGFY